MATAITISKKVHITSLLISSILIAINLTKYAPIENIRVIVFFCCLSIGAKHYDKIRELLGI
jgi:membrane-bound metal-dependent hydrolase YbcI (DUF457 family)